MTLQRWLPVATSIAIILVVAVLRDRSRSVAAVVATMPINVPLALWVISSGADGDSRVISDFMRATLIGLAPSVVWIGIVLAATRAGWGIWPAMAVGYVVWGLLIAGLFYAGVLKMPA
jgi:hypothetical protein